MKPNKKNIIISVSIIILFLLISLVLINRNIKIKNCYQQYCPSNFDCGFSPMWESCMNKAERFF